MEEKEKGEENKKIDGDLKKGADLFTNIVDKLNAIHETNIECLKLMAKTSLEFTELLNDLNYYSKRFEEDVRNGRFDQESQGSDPGRRSGRSVRPRGEKK